MSDEGKASVVVALWTLAFTAGLFIADQAKPLGFMIMIASTLVLAIILRADAKVEAEKRRRRRYEADCARRAEEAHSEWYKINR